MCSSVRFKNDKISISIFDEHNIIFYDKLIHDNITNNPLQYQKNN